LPDLHAGSVTGGTSHSALCLIKKGADYAVPVGGPLSDAHCKFLSKEYAFVSGGGRGARLACGGVAGRKSALKIPICLKIYNGGAG